MAEVSRVGKFANSAGERELRYTPWLEIKRLQSTDRASFIFAICLSASLGLVAPVVRDDGSGGKRDSCDGDLAILYRKLA